MMAIYGRAGPGLCMRGWSIDRGHIIIALCYSMTRVDGLALFFVPSFPKPFAVALGIILRRLWSHLRYKQKMLDAPRDSTRNKVDPLHGSISLYLMWCTELWVNLRWVSVVDSPRSRLDH